MFSIENVISGGAIGISITGMAIVFSGLVLISLAIAVLPKALDFVTGIFEKKEIASSSEVELESDSEEKDIASVIGLVMQMEANLHETEEQKEDIDIANVIGLVLHLEHERQFGLPN